MLINAVPHARVPVHRAAIRAPEKDEVELSRQFFGDPTPTLERTLAAEGNVLYAGVSPDGEKILYSDNSPKLYCYDQDGNQLFAVERGFIHRPPAFLDDGGLVVVESQLNGPSALTVLNPDGTQRWSTPLENIAALRAPLVTSDGTICAYNREPGTPYTYLLKGFDPADGTPLWSYPLGRDIKSDPVEARPGVIAAVDYKGTLHELDLQGQPLGQHSISSLGEITLTPGGNGTLYADQDLYHLKAFNPDGSERWTNSGTENIRWGPVQGEDLYLPTSGHGGLRAIDKESGSTRWEIPTPGLSNTHRAALDPRDNTVFLTQDTWLWEIKPDGTVDSRVRLPEHLGEQPAVTARGIAVVPGGRNVFLVDARDEGDRPADLRTSWAFAATKALGEPVPQDADQPTLQALTTTFRQLRLLVPNRFEVSQDTVRSLLTGLVDKSGLEYLATLERDAAAEVVGYLARQYEAGHRELELHSRTLESLSNVPNPTAATVDFAFQTYLWQEREPELAAHIRVEDDYIVVGAFELPTA